MKNDSLKKYLKLFLDVIYDNHTRVKDPLNLRTISTLIWETFRYRFAGWGVPFTQNEKKFFELRNKYKGKRAFILGNGPSLNLCNLTLLKNEYTFGVNSIFLNYDYMGFNPTFYVVEDVFVAEDRAPQINKYITPKIRFFGNYLQYCLSHSENTIWMNIRTDYSDYKGFPNFSTNAIRMLWVGGTVSYICMQLAHFMGFSNVYLIGFDHNYQIPSDAVVEGKKITSASDDLNHFHPDYFGAGYRWHDPEVERMERAYIKAKKYFERSGRVIQNATEGGYLNVFERVSYDSLFSEK